MKEHIGNIIAFASAKSSFQNAIIIADESLNLLRLNWKVSCYHTLYLVSLNWQNHSNLNFLIALTKEELLHENQENLSRRNATVLFCTKNNQEIRRIDPETICVSEHAGVQIFLISHLSQCYVQITNKNAVTRLLEGAIY